MSWLSLEILDAIQVSPKSPKKNPVRFVIPKKKIHLAVRRNRLRRLIKEAVRADISLADKKMYIFRVKRDPGSIGLKEVKEAVKAAWI